MIFGQDGPIDEVASAIKLSRSGLRSPEKPIGNFLFAGPTGVGKTELARQLARIMGIEFIRFDMSEYMEKHAVSRLIGAPPGYVGYEEGGLLIDAIRKSPHAVLLLDEIEKAHPDMFSILLQVMDHATLTDSHGRKADFRHVDPDHDDQRRRARPVGSPAGIRRAGQGRIVARRARADVHAGVPQPPRRDRQLRRARHRARSRRSSTSRSTRCAAMVAAKKVTIELDPAARAWLADEGVRSRVRRAADGAADRARRQEAAVGAAAVRVARRQGGAVRVTVENDAIRLVTGA